MNDDAGWRKTGLWVCRINGVWAAIWLLFTAYANKQAPEVPVTFWYWVMFACFCWCIFGWLYFTLRNRYLAANRESKPPVEWPTVIKQ